jgi:hypothetical protein
MPQGGERKVARHSTVAIVAALGCQSQHGVQFSRLTVKFKVLLLSEGLVINGKTTSPTY